MHGHKIYKRGYYVNVAGIIIANIHILYITT